MASSSSEEHMIDRSNLTSRVRFSSGEQFQFSNLQDEKKEIPRVQAIVGICAMEKKSLSKPMTEILSRMGEFEYIKTVIFPEDTIVNSPIDEWPICDCLIAFHSKGFPLTKTIEYANLRNPYIINNLEAQFDIQDRRMVYQILENAGIEIPRYAILDRDDLQKIV